MLYDVICIGAGPTGLATAIEAQRRKLRTLVIEKGCLCNSIFHYPTNMVFFTTPELIEIGGLPMVCAGEKPTRGEALKYYRRCAEHENLDVRLYERVMHVDARNGMFLVHTEAKTGTREQYRTKRIVVATGYYDLPNRLEVPGEDLPHVSHYYREAHPCWNRDVVVIGGKNSAVEAALDLYRGGARVTLVHRGSQLGASIKYWVRPDIENRIKAGQVKALFETVVTRIEPGAVWVRRAQNSAEEEQPMAADYVFAMTGYHPDFDFLRSLGVHLAPGTNKPVYDPETLESNVPGVYLAGVVIGGNQTGEIFIENGRFHGQQIVRAITGD